MRLSRLVECGDPCKIKKVLATPRPSAGAANGAQGHLQRANDALGLVSLLCFSNFHSLRTSVCLLPTELRSPREVAPGPNETAFRTADLVHDGGFLSTPMCSVIGPWGLMPLTALRTALLAEWLRWAIAEGDAACD